MAIVERIKRIIKANFKDLLKQSEDPEVIIEQMLEEMQQELREAKIQVAAAIRDQNKLEMEYKENLQNANKYEQKAIEFVKNNDDARAKEALRRKKSFEKMAENLKRQFDIQKQSVADLKKGLNSLEAKIEEAKRRKSLLNARKKRAEAQRTIHQSMAGMSSDSIDTVFKKINEEVIDVEADAEAASEIQKLNLEEQFKTLEKEDEEDISEELVELKQKLDKSSSS